MTTFDDRVTALRAAAEPTRLRLLVLLAEAELTVSELTSVLGQSQPSVSRHLRLLVEAGLVDRTQEGAWAFFRAADTPLVGSLIDGLTNGLTDGTVGDALLADQEGLSRVLARRAEAAGAYFAEQAARWDDLQVHYVADRAVEAAMRAMIGSAPVGRLYDLGTGTGRVLVALHGLYDAAIGIDVSAEMLSLARVRLAEAEVARARVRRGDLFSLVGEADADLVVMHHVLHFLHAPDEAIAAARRLLGGSGRLLIADFAAHDDETLRERHAHRRLGFDDDEIVRYARRAGLTLRRTEAVAPPPGGALTSKLWMLELKAGSRSGKTVHAPH